MNIEPFIDIELNEAVILISAALVCAANNDPKGIMDAGIQLGCVLHKIDQRLHQKANKQ